MSSQTVVDVVISGTTATVVESRIDGVTTVEGTPQVTNVSGQIPDLGVTTSYLAGQGEILSLINDVANLRANVIITGQTLTDEIGVLSGVLISTGNYLESNILTLSGNLIASGNNLDSLRDILSGNLITTGQTLQTQITSNDSDIADLLANLITTGQTLQTQITSNDGDISTLTSNLVTTGQTLTADVNTVSANLISTGRIVDDISGNLITTGQTLQNQITSNDGDITTLTSNLSTLTSNVITTGQTLQAQITSNDSDIATLDSTTVKLTTNQSIAGNKIFSDRVTINNLHVTGTEVIVDVENLAVKDNLIHINSGESGAGISRISGGITIDRGSEPAANILYNDATDRFELNFPLALAGNLAVTANQTGVYATAANLITTGQTLQTQITSNDGDISTLTSNLITTGATLTSEVGIVSGLITDNDGDITALKTATGVLKTSTDANTSNLISTGNFLESEIAIVSGAAGGAIVDALSGNLITTGQTLTTDINAVDSKVGIGSSNLIATGQTLQTQITSNDGDISTLTSNLITTGQTLTSEIIIVSGLTTGSSSDPDLSGKVDTLSGNLITTGQTLQTQITSNDGDISTLTTNLITTGQTLQTQITSNDSDISNLTSNVITTGQTLTSEIAIVSGIAESHTDVAALSGKVDDISGNLITTGQTLQTQITSNDGDITTLTSNLITTGQTLTSEIAIVSGIATGGSAEDFAALSGDLITTGQTLQTQITSNDSDISTLTSNLISTGSVVDDVSGNLIATGQTLTTSINTNSSNLITTGQTLTSEIAIVSGIAEAHTDVSALSGKVDDISGNLITTGQTLTTNINTVSTNLITTGQTLTTSIDTVSSNLVSTGAIVDDVSGNLITTGQTLQTQITSNDGDITNLTSNLITTGQTLTSEIGTVSGLITDNDAEITALLAATGELKTDTNTNASNLVITGQTLTSEIAIVSGIAEAHTDVSVLSGKVDDISGNLITTGQTLQTQITSNDTDISNLTANLISTGSIVDDISGNLITTGQTLQTQITSNDGDITNLTSNLITTGQTLTTEITTVSGLITDNDGDITALKAATGVLKTSTDNNTANLISTGAIVDDVSGNLITSGQTLQTQITSNDSDISTLTTNVITTGQTLTTDIDSKINTVTANLITTGQTLTSELAIVSGIATGGSAEEFADLSGNLITTGQTLQTQITSNDSDISTLTSNLVATGSVIDDISGNLITTGQTLQTQITSNDSDISTLTSNLVTTGQTLTTNVNTVASNLVSTGTVVDDISGNLITTGQTLQTQITSNDTDITNLTSNLVTTGQTLTTDINTVSSNLVSTGSVVDDISGNLITTGQTLQTQITSNDGDITSLTSNLITTGQTLQTQITSNDSDIATLDSTTVKITTNQSVAGNKIFTDTVTINNLTVTGTEVIVDVENLAVRDNIIHINSGESGAGISRISGGITIDRGTEPAANILYNDANDRFELNFPLATEGNLVASAANLITTGQTLTSSINTVSTNLVSTGSVVDDISGNLITTGQTLQTQITSNDGDISTLTSNLVTTGQTLTTNINTVSSNLVSTGAIVDDISGNLITTGQTLQTQITSNDTDITNLSSNLVTTGQTLTTSINTVANNLVTTGQTLTSEIATVSGLIPATVIDGAGTANKVPLWSDANTIGDSVISQSSSKIGIGTATPATDLHIRSADPVIRLEDSSPNGVYGSIDGAGGSLILSADQGVGAASSNIQLKVDNAEAMRVIAGGSVGIGTPTPIARLTTVTSGNEIGNLITGTITTESALHVEVNYLTTGRAGYFYSSAAGTQTRELVSIINDNALSTGTTALKITQDSTGPALVTLGGKVGIGIAAPAANFQLHSTDNEAWQYITTDAANKDVGIYMGLDYDGTANYIGIVFDQSDDALKLFNSNSIANHLVIKNDGNVGIGTSAPSADLEVSTASGGEFLVTRSGNSGVTLQQVNGGDATSGSLSIKAGTAMNLYTNGTGLALTINSSQAATFSGNVLVNSGSIILYGDGDALFAGTSANMSWDRSDSALEFQDNAKIKLGTGDDLQIYHDGTDSFVKDAGQGNLKLLTDEFRLRNAADSAHMLTSSQGGAVTIYHNGAQKLITTSTGVTVTGALKTTTILDTNNSAGTSNQVLTSTGSALDWKTLGEISGVDGSGTANYLSKWTDTDTIGNSSIFDNDSQVTIDVPVGIVAGSGSGTLTGRLQIGSTTSSANNSLVFWRGAKPTLAANQGAILYESSGMSDGEGMTFMSDKGYKFLDDAGTTEWVRIISDGKVGIGTTAPAHALDVVKAGTIVVRAQNSSSSADASFYATNTLGTGIFGINATGQYMYGLGNFPLLFYANYAERMRVQADGKVGIGTATPGAKLHVSNSTTAGQTGLLISQTHGGSGTSWGLSVDVDVNSDSDNGAKFDCIRGTANVTILEALTNGTSRFKVQGDGKVGIGTDAPYRDLQVGGGSGNVRVGGGAGLDILHDNGGYTTADIKQLYAASNAAAHLRITGGFTTFCTGTNGAEKLRIQADGKVGIGTNAPKTKLDITGSHVADHGVFRVNAPGTSESCFMSLNTTGNSAWSGIYINESDTRQMALKWSGSDNTFGIYDEAGPTARLIVEKTGNVGIGTTAPARKLDVVSGHIRLDAGYSLLWDNGHERIEAVNTGIIKFFTNNGQAMTLSGSNVGIGIAAPTITDGGLQVHSTASSGRIKLTSATTGSGSTDGFALVTDASGNIYYYNREQTHQGFYNHNGTSVAEVCRMTSDGTLDLKSAKFKINGSAGSSGQTLTTDGSGNISWSSAGSGTISGSGTDNYIPRFNGTSAIQNSSVYAKDDGNVGIGTAAPLRPLHVYENGGDLAVIRIENGGSHVAGIELWSGHGNWAIHNSDTIADALEFRDDSAAVTRMIIRNTGCVGIGTRSPATIVHAYSSVQPAVIQIEASGTNNAAFRLRDANHYWDIYQDGSTNRLGFWNTAGEAVSILGDGKVGIGIAAPLDLLHLAAGGKMRIAKSGDASRYTQYEYAGVNTNANDGYSIKLGGTTKYKFINDRLGIGSTSPAAPLDVARASDYKVIKLGDDITSHYVLTGNADHTLTLTCGSYFQAEIVITANQTASGTYNNLYIRGIWSNNYTSHHWDEIENIGSLSGSTFTITNGQNGATTESGEWKIVHDYVSGTFAGMTVRITDFYGTHAYTIS